MTSSTNTGTFPTVVSRITVSTTPISTTTVSTTPVSTTTVSATPTTAANIIATPANHTTFYCILPTTAPTEKSIIFYINVVNYYR